MLRIQCFVVFSKWGAILVSEFDQTKRHGAWDVGAHTRARRLNFNAFLFFTLYNPAHMSLWTDKYKPTSLDKLTFHEGLSQQLKSLVHFFISCISIGV